VTARPRTVEFDYRKTQSRTYRPALLVKIGVSRQIVIPKTIHDQRGLQPGDYLEVRIPTKVITDSDLIPITVSR